MGCGMWHACRSVWSNKDKTRMIVSRRSARCCCFRNIYRGQSTNGAAGGRINNVSAEIMRTQQDAERERETGGSKYFWESCDQRLHGTATTLEIFYHLILMALFSKRCQDTRAANWLPIQPLSHRRQRASFRCREELGDCEGPRRLTHV